MNKQDFKNLHTPYFIEKITKGVYKDILVIVSDDKFDDETMISVTAVTEKAKTILKEKNIQLQTTDFYKAAGRSTLFVICLINGLTFDHMDSNQLDKKVLEFVNETIS